MHQARPRAWASLTQNPGAQLPQPGTQPLPQQFLQHRLLELRVVQDGEQRGPSNNGCQHICWLSLRSLPSNTIRSSEHLQADKMAQQDSPTMKELGPYLHSTSHRACRTCGGNATLLRGLPSLPSSSLSLTITTTTRAHCSRLQPLIPSN